MDIALSDQQEAFRAEVRSFLEDNLTPELREAARHILALAGRDAR